MASMTKTIKNFSDIRDRAGLAAARLRDDLQARAHSFEIRTGGSPLRAVVCFAVAVGAVYLMLWAYTWWVRADERARFRAEIAAASPRVRGAMLAGAADAETQDRIALDAIRGTDNALTNSEADLRQAATSSPLDGCPRVPARCLASGLVPAAGGGGVR